MPVTIITSDNRLAITEQHFKVTAGPGAGKTRFLVNHILHLLNCSAKLKGHRKIACITYTNVATETILYRVGDHGGKVEINTIHSFFYKYLVRPYVISIADDFHLNALAIEGHDDILVTNFPFFQEWQKRTSSHYVKHQDAIKGWESLRWKFDGNTGNLKVTPRYPIYSGKYPIRYDSYFEYKKMTWEKGLLHHDDVLFFSYELVRRKPFLLDVLRAIFPYFLVDEFQDTSPIQIEILKLLAQRETIIGVVGDEAQSIYSFLGAQQNQLQQFLLPGMTEYQINDNRRSSNEIVNLLNIIRPTLTQTATRNASTAQVKVVVGDKLKALQWFTSIIPSTKIVTLARENLTANAMSKGIGVNSGRDLFTELKAKDNTDRRRTISNVTKAIEYTKLGYIKDAIKTIGKTFNYNRTIVDQKRSLHCLKTVLENRHLFEGKKIIDLYNFLNQSKLYVLKKLIAGGAKTFYETEDYDALAISVKNLYEAGSHRTIHKAKGDEFEAVMLVLDKDVKGNFNESNELAFLLSPNLSVEEQRIMYVAVSRPKNHLAISVPTLSQANDTILKGHNIFIHRIL